MTFILMPVKNPLWAELGASLASVVWLLLWALVEVG